MKITIIFERFVVLMWKYLNFQFSPNLFLMTYSVYKKNLSSECGVSFYWGPAMVNFDSSLFWNWADDKQSKARNSDSKYRQMALVGFDT